MLSTVDKISARKNVCQDQKFVDQTVNHLVSRVPLHVPFLSETCFILTHQLHQLSKAVATKKFLAEQFVDREFQMFRMLVICLNSCRATVVS